MSANHADLWNADLPDALMLLDGAGRVCRWGAGAQQMFGYESAEAVGVQLDALIVIPGGGEEQHSFVTETLRRGSSTFETLRRRKDGTLIYVDISGQLLQAATKGADTLLLFSEKDVTSLKIQRDSKALELRYRELLESTPDGIVIVNPTGHILIANTQAERLFGYAPGELRALLVDMLLPERFRHAHKGHRSNYFAQSRTRPMGAGLELYGLRKDGLEFPVEISLSPLTTEETPLVMSAIRDVSERRRILQSLQEKNLELERADRAKDRFLASMSHELRTPLNAVIGFTGTLLMGLPGALNAEQTRQLDIVRNNARHLLSLINDLLNLAKIQADRVQLDPEPTECGSLVRETAASLQPFALAKGLQLLVEVPEEAVIFRTDRRALTRILLNLVQNAIKFTDVGQVQLALSVDGVGTDRALEIVVADTGPGIGEDEQATLFGAFVQGRSAGIQGREGTGLGLHLSRKLAELLGGELQCHSTLGAGSRFVLRLKGA